MPAICRAAIPPKSQDPVFYKALAAQKAKLKAAYLEGEPVESAVTEQDLLDLENPPGAPGVEAAKWIGVARMERIRDFAKLLTAAGIIQNQKDPAVRASPGHRENLDAMAIALALGDYQRQVALLLYGDPALASKPPVTPREARPPSSPRSSPGEAPPSRTWGEPRPKFPTRSSRPAPSSRGSSTTSSPKGARRARSR